MNPEYELPRRCKSKRKDTKPCGSYAVRGDPSQMCRRHGGVSRNITKTCYCKAYWFPHRKRAGYCNYPYKPTKWLVKLD